MAQILNRGAQLHSFHPFPNSLPPPYSTAGYHTIHLSSPFLAGCKQSPLACTILLHFQITHIGPVLPMHLDTKPYEWVFIHILLPHRLEPEGARKHRGNHKRKGKRRREGEKEKTEEKREGCLSRLSVLSFIPACLSLCPPARPSALAGGFPSQGCIRAYS